MTIYLFWSYFFFYYDINLIPFAYGWICASLLIDTLGYIFAILMKIMSAKKSGDASDADIFISNLAISDHFKTFIFSLMFFLGGGGGGWVSHSTATGSLNIR